MFKQKKLHRFMQLFLIHLMTSMDQALSETCYLRICLLTVTWKISFQG